MKRIAITGGPCSGKDTALNEIVPKWLKEWGFIPIVIPEVATLVIGSGFSPAELLKMGRGHYLDMERVMIRIQANYIKEMLGLSAGIVDSDKIIILENRGLMDVKSYMAPKEFKAMIRRELDLSEIACRDELYDAVFHFRTVADGKPDLYMKLYRNNKVRYEDTPEKAIATDNRTLSAWLGHPHLRVIPNTDLRDNLLSFEQKLELFRNELAHALGVYGKYEIERKFLVETIFQSGTIQVPSAKVAIDQIYLKNNLRLRRREQDGYFIHYLAKKSKTKNPRIRHEEETRISGADYNTHLTLLRDKKYAAINKTRFYFVWKNQYFELDIFNAPKKASDIVLLEIELTEPDKEIEIPNWLGAVREVTDENKYSNKELARTK